MVALLQERPGLCPNCGDRISYVDGAAARDFGEPEYICPSCGWLYDVGHMGDGGIDGIGS